MTQTRSCPPVLVVGFNRPHTTRRVLEALRIVEPARVFLAVDGPRPSHPDDAQRVAQVRDLVSMLDWDCEVQTLFRPENLGCKLGVSGAITWFFENVEAGIILEDDCVAHRSFFPYAAELLERYRNDERVLMVSGDNFQQGRRRNDFSYYFSRYAHIWGWATWRRAWLYYDQEMKSWPDLRDRGWLDGMLGDRKAAHYWSSIFEDTYRNRNSSWAYRWQFCIWARDGLTILPACNLVSNIGFDEFATHTVQATNPWARLAVEAIPIPLLHRHNLSRDDVADAHTQETVFASPSVWKRMLGKCRKFATSLVGRQT